MARDFYPKCPRFTAALKRVEALPRPRLSLMLTTALVDAAYRARNGQCRAAGRELAFARQVLKRDVIRWVRPER